MKLRGGVYARTRRFGAGSDDGRHARRWPSAGLEERFPPPERDLCRPSYFAGLGSRCGPAAE